MSCLIKPRTPTASAAVSRQDEEDGEEGPSGTARGDPAAMVSKERSRATAAGGGGTTPHASRRCCQSDSWPVCINYKGRREGRDGLDIPGTPPARLEEGEIRAVDHIPLLAVVMLLRGAPLPHPTSLPPPLHCPCLLYRVRQVFEKCINKAYTLRVVGVAVGRECTSCTRNGLRRCRRLTPTKPVVGLASHSAGLL